MLLSILFFYFILIFVYIVPYYEQTFILLAYFISLCLAVFYVSVSHSFLLRRDVRCYFAMSSVRQIVHMAHDFYETCMRFSFSEQANFPKNPKANKSDFCRIFLLLLFCFFFVDKWFHTITIYLKILNEKSHTQIAHSLPEMCWKHKYSFLGLNHVDAAIGVSRIDCLCVSAVFEAWRYYMMVLDRFKKC